MAESPSVYQGRPLQPRGDPFSDGSDIEEPESFRAQRLQQVRRRSLVRSFLIAGSVNGLILFLLSAGRRRSKLDGDEIYESVEAFEEETRPTRSPPWMCAENGEDCRKRRCCSQPGATCFEKNEYWASCNLTCSSPHWGCKALSEPAPPVCSWESENCASSACCRRAGFKCYRRDERRAGCGISCEERENVTGKPWNCEVLGGDIGTHVVAKSLERPAGSSLYCFTVVTVGGVVPPGVQAGYESELLAMMRRESMGIFACNASSVFEGKRARSGSWKSVVNTGIFLDVWKQVKQEGKYEKHAWTVKADADAVFFPDRLRMHIVSLSPPADTAVYLHNIDFRFHFMGALEVLSRRAVDAFVDNLDACAENLGLSGGEDFFTMQCLDASFVGHMTDFSLLDDKFTLEKGWHLFDVDPCVDPTKVAYHPFKHVNSWHACWDVALGRNSTTDYVGCDFRWPGDACSLTSIKKH